MSEPLATAAWRFAVHVSAVACDHEGATGGTHTGCPERLALDTALADSSLDIDATRDEMWDEIANEIVSPPDQSDGLAAAVIEWADSEQVVRQNPSPSREEWHRVLVARERLRDLRAALAESDSANP